MNDMFFSPKVTNLVGIAAMVYIAVLTWGILFFLRRKLYLWSLGCTCLGLCSYWLFEVQILPYHVNYDGEADWYGIEHFMPSGVAVMIVGTIVSLASIGLVVFLCIERIYRVNAGSIKYCIDTIPIGVCYYYENGRVILANACMKRICYETTGRALLNAVEFVDSQKEEYITLKDKTVWKIETSQKKINNEVINELICTDVSKIIQKRRNLSEKNKEIAGLNEKLKTYQLDIDEYIKQKEILKTKMDIHDEMNKLMLMTVFAADTKDSKALEEVLHSWQRNAEVTSGRSRIALTDFENVEALAGMLGIEICGKECFKSVPGADMELFCMIAREALINASKHSEATKLKMNMEKIDDEIHFYFVNEIADNKSGEVNFTGGLLNLKRLIEERQGEFRAHTEKGEFILELVLFNQD